MVPGSGGPVEIGYLDRSENPDRAEEWENCRVPALYLEYSPSK